jgi:hypothetical protein
MYSKYPILILTNISVDSQYILTCNTVEHNGMSKSKKCRDIVDSGGDNNGVIPRIVAELT